MREINGYLEHIDGSPAKNTAIYFSIVDTSGQVTSSDKNASATIAGVRLRLLSRSINT